MALMIPMIPNNIFVFQAVQFRARPQCNRWCVVQWSGFRIWIRRDLKPTVLQVDNERFILLNMPNLKYNTFKCMQVQAALVIRGLFLMQIRLFAFEECSKMTNFQTKMNFLSANSRFAVQNDRTYLPRITRETCTSKNHFESKNTGPKV